MAPSMQVEGELYIHTARTAVWDKFCRLVDWPRWNSAILAAEWVQGEPWTEGATFRLHHRTLLGSTTTTTALLRMVVPGRTAVWESHSAGMQVVHTADFADELGGCKLRARHVYHGAPVLGFRFLRGRQQRLLEQAMQELKAFVERR